MRKFYEPFGKIKEINLLRHQDGKLVGCGFIQFEHMEDASKAIFNTNKKEFYGNSRFRLLLFLEKYDFSFYALNINL